MNHPASPRSVGRYELIREIGGGGMAVVHLARQPGLQRLVAIKELATFFATDAAMAERFLNEARLAGSLSHPNVVTVFDYIAQDGVPYIVMEYLPGGSLRPRARHLALAQAVGVLQAVLAGLESAEQHGIVHRDLKPENLMVSAEGVKIADFGIAKAVNDVTTNEFRTATGTTVGTPAYMAPEQAMGLPVTAATDLYSFGVVAYELLLRRLPFDSGENPLVVLLRHANDAPPTPRSITPAFDAELEDWLLRLLAKDPSARPQSAAAAGEALEDIAIRLLGPRWRRAAAISAAAAASAPVVAVPEAGAHASLVSGSYVTVRPGRALPAAWSPRTVESAQGEPAETPPPPPLPTDDTGAAAIAPPAPVRQDDAFQRSWPEEGTPPPRAPMRDLDRAPVPTQPGNRHRWRWVLVFAVSTAIAATAAVILRHATDHTGQTGPPSGEQQPAIDLTRLRPGPYTIDPPRGWECARAPCRERPDRRAFRVDFVRGPASVSVLRYPLDPSQRGDTPRSVLLSAARDSLRRVQHGGFPPDAPGRGRVRLLGTRQTWEYSATSRRYAAAGVTFIERGNGYQIAGLGPPANGTQMTHDVRAFATTLVPLTR
jgi:hypothetical protein